MEWSTGLHYTAFCITKFAMFRLGSLVSWCESWCCWKEGTEDPEPCDRVAVELINSSDRCCLCLLSADEDITHVLSYVRPYGAHSAAGSGSGSHAILP